MIYKVDVRWYVKTYGAVRLCSAKSENCRRREKKLNIKFMIKGWLLLLLLCECDF